MRKATLRTRIWSWWPRWVWRKVTGRIWKWRWEQSKRTTSDCGLRPSAPIQTPIQENQAPTESKKSRRMFTLWSQTSKGGDQAPLRSHPWSSLDCWKLKHGASPSEAGKKRTWNYVASLYRQTSFVGLVLSIGACHSEGLKAAFLCCLSRSQGVDVRLQLASSINWGNFGWHARVRVVAGCRNVRRCERRKEKTKFFVAMKPIRFNWCHYGWQKLLPHSKGW